MTSRRFAPIDALLVLMAVIWGANYSIVKGAFSEINPQAFNAVRMTIASSVFLMLIVGLRRIRLRQGFGGQVGGQVGRTADRARDGMDSIAGIFHSPAAITRSDWVGLVSLGVVGHFLYQYLFINGLAMTSVANSSLMLAATPVVIALVTALLGHDRVSALHWIGAALSVVGIYAVVGHGMQLGSSSIRGDALMFGAVCCWATYTIGARPLMVRHSPVGVTGLSMAIGTVLYVLASVGPIRAVHWSSVSGGTWLAIVFSALFALCVSYTIWYAAVREIGSSRTSVYSNLVPLVAMVTAVLFLGEPLSARKIFGAAAVLSGVALTRVGRTGMAIPAEE